MELLVAEIIVGIMLGIGFLRSRKPKPPETRVTVAPPATEAETALKQVQSQLRNVLENQAKQQGVMEFQVEQLLDSTMDLRDETYKLTGALSNNQIRGNWGEIQLRRVLELAGMLPHVDFDEQVQLDNGAKRPDAVVHIPGGRHIIIDSKASMMYYLELVKTDDEFANRDGLLVSHAKGLKQHVNSLSSKEYWKSLPGATEFVVLFMPNDSALAAAVTTDGTLMEYAADRRIILAGPSTLLAILFGAAQGWRQETAVANVQEIADLGIEMYGRVQAMSVPLDEAQRKLDEAQKALKNLAWHASNRVYPTGRRLQGLVGSPKDIMDRAETEA